MEKLILKDLDSANKILELALPFLENPDQFNYDFEVNNEQLVVHMKIYGSKFNDSITGQVARGLWEFQREIYRAVAFTLYGQASIKKLTKEDLEKYNLIFKVNDGCTDINANIDSFLKALLEAMSDMNPVQKIVLIVAIVSIFTFGYVTIDLEGKRIETESATQIELAKIDLEKARLEAQTKQMELMAKVKENQPIAAVWNESVKEGIKSVAKSLEENDSMDYGDHHLSKEAIQQLKQKSPRTAPEEETITDKFTLYGFKEISAGQVQFDIRGPSGEYTVLMDSDTFSHEEMTYLGHIAADRKTAELTIKLLTVRDKVKAAYVADFEKPDTSLLASE